MKYINEFYEKYNTNSHPQVEGSSMAEEQEEGEV